MRLITIIAMCALLTGCDSISSTHRDVNNMAGSISLYCVNGYVFAYSPMKGGISQFWEIGQNGEPVPLMCNSTKGGIYEN